LAFAAILCIAGIVWLALAYFIPAPLSLAVGFKGGSRQSALELTARLASRLLLPTACRSQEPLKTPRFIRSFLTRH
jgi:hypothetical protein